MNEWDSYAEGWDDDEMARAYAAAAYASLRDLMAENSIAIDGADVLDFGCGTGLLTELLAPHVASIVAVDTSPAMLDVLTTKITGERWSHVQTGRQLPVAESSIDLIVCSSVCSFLDDYPATSKHLVSLLRPGGWFIQWDWERVDDDVDSHGFSRAEITDALSAAGLDRVAVETAFSIPAGDQSMEPLIGYGQRP